MRVGTRAFDILELLIRCQGQLVSKEQILQRVWPDTVVEENNLQVHISALRKVLGPDRDLIRTIPGRGYLLVGGDGGFVDSAFSGQLHEHHGAVLDNHSRMPAAVELLGREGLLEELTAALGEEGALVTLLGPGGVGKTALAAEVARRGFEGKNQPVYFVPLAQLQCGELLLDTLGNALNLECAAADSLLQSVVQRLVQQPGLIVLDNCEHLIDRVAALVELLRRIVPTLRVIATSREPLRVAGERSVQVPPLEFANASAERAAILASTSAQLFLRHWRALDSHTAHGGDGALDDYSVELVGEVCRRLEGIPLGLEMAAARACALGLYQLLSSLDDSIHLLSASLRTAPPRHQTLQASVQWGYRLLSADERTVLRSLAGLDGRFTLEQACDSMQRTGLARPAIMDCVVRLATKSWLMVSVQGPYRFYRMPAATRACLLAANIQEPLGEVLRPALQELDAPTLASLQVPRAVPIGPDGYHARHQRALATGR
ncbi:ATP-binding protein [Pseudomonas sp. NPDC090202]|uniref:ATP-binding protein n=1 Tax=unclassified Pseudomonas TaxID=196821 RepID=UPI003820F6F7